MRSIARRLSLALVAGGLALSSAASAQSPLPFPFPLPGDDPHGVPGGNPAPAPTPVQALVSAASAQVIFVFALQQSTLSIVVEAGYQTNADLRNAGAPQAQINEQLELSLSSVTSTAAAINAALDANAAQVRTQVLALGGTEADLVQLVETTELFKTITNLIRDANLAQLRLFAETPELPPPYNGQPLPPAPFPFPFPFPEDPALNDGGGKQRASTPSEKPKEKPKHAERSDTDRKARNGSRR